MKYDKNTRQQLKNIKQDNEIDLLEISLADLAVRVQILEDARVVQRGLNVKFEALRAIPEVDKVTKQTWYQKLFSR